MYFGLTSLSWYENLNQTNSIIGKLKKIYLKLVFIMQLTYNVPNNTFLRIKWISYVGHRWRGFKSDLTSQYIYSQLSNKNPCEIY